MSSYKKKKTGRMLIGLGVVVSLSLLASCNKTRGGTGAPGAAELAAAGKNVFATNNCSRCHSIGGQGGRKGPDLSHAGADPSHTPQWLADHVRNPKAQNPSSRMPAFQGRISEPNLNALGAYLASLK
jgi:mono/diheme cytochrome c family protein